MRLRSRGGGGKREKREKWSPDRLATNITTIGMAETRAIASPEPRCGQTGPGVNTIEAGRHIRRLRCCRWVAQTLDSSIPSAHRAGRVLQDVRKNNVEDGIRGGNDEE
ncbi:hypothetical protein B0H19DRAFT_1084293 [Mycena capillaripes]|nr:hypothetical protein B0H19DRAFT_1084293 [Mycena capillaripes]